MPATKVYDSSAELDLIHRARSGDEHAFRILYDAHQNRVFVTVKRIIADDEMSQWVTNIALTQVWKNLAKFKEESKFSTWITRIAINEAKMYLRSQKRRQREVSLDNMLADSGRSGIKKGESSRAFSHDSQNFLATRDTDLEGIADRQVLERSLNRVPQQFREVLRLRFWEGMSLDEIQKKINHGETQPISMSAVKSRILRGRSILMEQVERIS